MISLTEKDSELQKIKAAYLEMQKDYHQLTHEQLDNISRQPSTLNMSKSN